HVGAVLRLVDHPVVALTRKPGLFEQRIDLPRPALEQFWPGEFGKALSQLLSFGRVVQLRQGVVVLYEADPCLVKLSCQPVMAVDVDLGGEGEPGLHADVTQAELRIEEVKVQHTLLPPGEGQPGTALAVEELDGAAGFHAAQDADPPLAQAAVADGLPDDVLLAVAALEVVVGGTVLLGEGFGVGDELLGFIFEEAEEVLAGHAEGVINKAVEVGIIAKGEMALEDDSIEAAENGDEGSSELDGERVGVGHGVLLRDGACATPFWPQNAAFALSALVAA